MKIHSQRTANPVAASSHRRLQGRQSGVALVATLIMLSLVTFMVVAFLGVARRERRSIEAVTSANDAKTAMETALARAQGDVIARLLTFGDKWNYGLLVPTNYQSATFNPLLPPSNQNVNYTNAMAQGLAAWLVNLGNLQFDARPPVFSANYTNVTPFDPLASETNQGRYYLDFNRNGMFDYTDRFQTGDPHWLGMQENSDQLHGPNNRFTARYTYLVVPAGQTYDVNFIHNAAKRRGSVAVSGAAPFEPAGTLMNGAYTTYEGYYRNLGIAPSEFNLAAMLTEAAPLYYGYNYDTNAGNPSAFAPNARDPFRDAWDVLRFRLNTNYNNNSTLTALFGAVPAATLVGAQFDALANGPLSSSSNLAINIDSTVIQWAAGSNRNVAARHYFDMNELFMNGRSYTPTLTPNLQFVGTNNQLATPAGDRDRRQLYNLLSTVGTESWPVDGKMNLNWSNIVFTATNISIGSSGGDVSGFTSWDADYFYFNAAELMLRASFNPSVIINSNWTGFGGADANVLVTNYFIGTNFIGTNVGTTLSVTNIPIFPFNFYTPEVNRILQFTANLYDATTTNAAAPAYPTLFRPYFGFNTNGVGSVRISGYTTNGTDAGSLLALPVVDITDTNNLQALYAGAAGIDAAGNGTNFNTLIAGYPVIVGAKKGYPNFNELGVQTIFMATRRLEFVKTNATNFGPGAIIMTNQSLVISLTNVYGLEAWNSYAGSFPQPINANRPLRLEASHVADVAVGWFINRHLTNSYELFSSTNFMLVYTNRTTNNVLQNFGGNSWPGTAAGLSSFKGFFFTNALLATNNTPARGYAFATNLPPFPGFTNGGFLAVSPFAAASPSAFNRSNGFPDLRLHVTVTNSLRYALTEPNSNRVVDFVNLANMVVGTNISTPQSAIVFPAGIGKWWRLAHGLIDGMDLRFYSTGALPGGMAPGNTYYVRDVTANDFNVALAPGGPPIGLGGGAGSHWYVAPTDENLAVALGSGGTNNGGLFWLTGRQGGVMAPTEGISNQIAFSLDTNVTSAGVSSLWRQYSPTANPAREVDRARRFLGLSTVFPVNQLPSPTITHQLGFTPTRVVSISASWEVNDPLVHHTIQDLTSPFVPVVLNNHPLNTRIPPPGTVYRVDTIQNRPTPNQPWNFAYQPWGYSVDFANFPSLTNVAAYRNAAGQGYYELAGPAYDQRLKDPGIFSSDQWDFPQRKFANLGWIGRVHRGTPWQTAYLKASAPNPTNWFYWAHSADTNPTNDWRLVDVFSTAINADATRSLLSVNQTNSVAWAALSGTLVLTNNGFASANWPMVVAPASWQLTNIVGGLTNGLINAKQSIGMWQPTANYSANDIVGYWFGSAGKAFYRSLTSSNINQNPYNQTTANFFGSWTNVYYWNNAATYTAGDVVAYYGVSYISLINGNVNYAPHAFPDVWEPYPKRSFTKMGYVLSTPELSSQSPYLNIGSPWQVNTAYAAGARVLWQGWYYQATRPVPINQPPNPYYNYTDLRTMAQTYWWPLESPAIARVAGTADVITDAFIERLPQQTLGLLTLEQSPRLTIYAYGQSLRPAERGVYVSPGPYQLMVTNYQITGEVASRTVVRIEGLPEPGFLPRPLPAGAPPQVQPHVVIESFRLLSSDY